MNLFFLLFEIENLKKLSNQDFPYSNKTLEIGSFGFNMDELTYSWMASPLSMEDSLELAQYQMLTWHNGHKVVQMKNGVRSVIYVKFEFKRAIGFYILQVQY